MPFRFAPIAVWAAGFVLLVVNGLIVFGAVSGALDILVAALLALFVSLTVLFAFETFRSLEHGDGFAVDSQWGGLGGGLGGWQVSRPLMFLFAALACAGLTFAVASPELPSADTEATDQTAADGAAKPGEPDQTAKAEPPADKGS
jgi:hypothetical protein